MGERKIPPLESQPLINGKVEAFFLGDERQNVVQVAEVTVFKIALNLKRLIRLFVERKLHRIINNTIIEIRHSPPQDSRPYAGAINLVKHCIGKICLII
jgi:hypothetical protein